MLLTINVISNFKYFFFSAALRSPFFQHFFFSSNSGYVYGSYGECVVRVDALAAGLEKGGENLLDKNDDGMLLVRNGISINKFVTSQYLHELSILFIVSLS